MSRPSAGTFLAIALIACAPALAWGQEPATRAEALRLEREKKATDLAPPQQSRLERALLDLESGRAFERLLNPAEGLYPKIGNVTAGSGISFGPGYRKPGLFGGHADFSGFIAASFKQYWLYELRLTMPRLANDHLLIDVHGQRYSFPEQEFFGIGPDSNRDDLVTYGIQDTVVGVLAAYRPLSWLTVSGGVDRMSPDIEAGSEPGDLLSIFDGGQTPGVFVQPDYLTYRAGVALNYSQPRGNPRRGGAYFFSAQRFDDRDTGAFTFDSYDIDLRQYIPILRDRRVLALRGLVSVAETDAGSTVPFYLLRTLGGPDDLRGFRRFRFRDRNALLLQAEYRFEIFPALDGAIFYDAGKVSPDRAGLSLKDLESDYGIGFRFGTANGVFLRIEGAFGSAGGKHFILRFGNVF